MNPDQLLQQGRAVLAQTKAEGLKSYATSKYAKKTPVDFNRLKTIPAELVASNPQPYNLNLPTPNVPSSGLQPIIDSSVATYKTQSEQDRLAREQAQTNAKSDLSKSINDIMGLNEEIGNVSSTVDRTEENKSRAEVDRLVSEIEAEQKSLQDKLARLDKNPQGLFGGALEDEKNRIRRESESRQADLSISLNAQNRNYTRAKEIADSEVQNKLEPLKIKLENLKFFYQENKELFNKEDERLYNEKIKSEERAYAKEENLQKTIMDLKIEAAKSGNSSVMSALSKVDTTNPKAFDEILKIAAPVIALSANEITEVGGRKAIVNKLTGTVKYLDGGTGVTTRTVNGQPVDGYTLIAGDDPYFIAQQYGTDMNNLKALNPNISNWNNIQPGAVINVPSKDAGRTEALATILGSSKFTKDQVALVTNAINNGQDPFTVVKNQAKDIMGQTLATELDKYETAKSQLTSIDSLLKDYYAKGGQTSYLTGKYEKAINNLGSVNDPALVEIATNIASALQIYRNAVSGTAYSVQEGKDIASIFPGINKSNGLNNAIVNGRLQAFDTTIDQKYRNTLGGAYDTLKQSSKPPVDPIQNIKSYGETHPEARATLIQMQNDNVPIELISQWVTQHQ